MHPYLPYLCTATGSRHQAPSPHSTLSSSSSSSSDSSCSSASGTEDDSDSEGRRCLRRARGFQPRDARLVVWDLGAARAAASAFAAGTELVGGEGEAAAAAVEMTTGEGQGGAGAEDAGIGSAVLLEERLEVEAQV